MYGHLVTTSHITFVLLSYSSACFQTSDVQAKVAPRYARPEIALGIRHIKSKQLFKLQTHKGHLKIQSSFRFYGDHLGNSGV
jgi:hypothetical protein